MSEKSLYVPDNLLREFELTLPESQRWENLTLANDFVFGHIMRNAELCTEMIRRILPDMDIGHIEFIQPQKSEKYSFGTRGVRFDVYAKSDNRKLFDCEIQTSDKHDLPRRTRAYHVMLGLKALETDFMKKSGMYNDIPDAFVIFICTFDPFNLGRHIYTFTNTCSEDNGLKLNDGSFTVFLNAKGKADDINGELKAFLDFLLGKPCDDPFIKKLERELNLLKQSAEWRGDYMRILFHERETYNEGFSNGLNKGFNDGLNEGKKNGSLNMLNSVIEFLKSRGMNDEQINDLRSAVSKS